MENRKFVDSHSFSCSESCVYFDVEELKEEYGGVLGLVGRCMLGEEWRIILPEELVINGRFKIITAVLSCSYPDMRKIEER